MDKHNKHNKHKRERKTEVSWYYNIDTRKDIFIDRRAGKIKQSPYSAVELYLLLKQINEHEPALIDMIISFMGIKNNIYYWARFYYNISLSKEDMLLIKHIYPVKYDNAELCISKVDYYLNNKQFSSLFQTIIKDMETTISKKPKYGYYKYPKDLIRTLGLFNIMKHKPHIIEKRLLYEKTNNDRKDHFHSHQIYHQQYLTIAMNHITLCKEKYKEYIKDICKEIQHCYILGN